MRTDILPRFDIGENIRAAEGVNRLFRVTDKQQPVRICRCAVVTGVFLVDSAEDPVLLGIGIRNSSIIATGKRLRSVCASRAPFS